MSVRITNTSRQALAVPLNSGNAVHLAPGETSDPIDEVETTGNPKIEKMSKSGLISVAYVEADDDPARGSAAGARKKAKA